MADEEQALVLESEPYFPFKVTGTWGEFSTAAGRVPYLLTSARLSRDGDGDLDDEARLTRHLKPVREGLPTLGDEDFRFLLQRPLDDYRVADSLVPYLLDAHHGMADTGEQLPRFFPSILVAALPFVGDTPQEEYPARDPEDGRYGTDESFRMGAFYEETFGDAFRVRRLAKGDQLALPRIGQFAWAEERIRLIILDGQHRAMALLAVQRKLDDSWPDVAADYKEFYSEINLPADLDVSSIRVPVTLVWFPPTEDGQSQNPLRAARSMFVTVNNSARAVGPARLMLLDDNNLKHIFTRSLLERMRHPEVDSALSILPATLYEDSDATNARAKHRWPKLVDHLVLGAAVHFTMFSGKSDQFSEKLSAQGKPNDSVMRGRLVTRAAFDKYEDPISGEVFEEAGLGHKRFPKEWVSPLVKRFQESYGDAVLWLFSEVGPFRAHLRALRWQEDRRDEWEGVGGGRIAYRAVFEANGLWGVIRGPKGRSGVAASARTVLETQRDLFEARRTLEFLGLNPESPSRAVTQQERERTDRAFDKFKTDAAQVGLIGLLVALVKKLEVPRDEVAEFGRVVAEALRISMEGAGPQGDPRRWALLQKEPDLVTLNLMTETEPQYGPFYRYLWLELLTTEQAVAHMAAWLAAQDAALASSGQNWIGGLGDPGLLKDALDNLADEARIQYLDHLVEQLAKQKIATGGVTPAVANAEARVAIRNALGAALSRLIGKDLPADPGEGDGHITPGPTTPSDGDEDPDAEELSQVDPIEEDLELDEHVAE